MFTDLNLTDMETCYKVVRAPLMKKLILTTDRFGFEPEITARLAQAHARIWEAADFLLRPDVRGREEDRLEGWRRGVLAHRALQPVPAAQSVMRQKDRDQYENGPFEDDTRDRSET